MRALERLREDEALRVEGVITDLDDTMLDQGRLGEAAYGALWRAQRAGLPVLVATGRPAGWGEVLARQWPVVGVVAENGGVAFQRVGVGVERVERVSAEERQARRLQLACGAAELTALFPELQAADDNETRLSDVTFDVGERVQLPPDRVAQIAAQARSWGFRVTVSSVHLHLSLDGDDKASGALWFLQQRLGLDPSRARGRWAFVGDSSNDAPCFAAFSLTFGVANVLPALPLLSRPPRYLAPGARGEGFVQVIDALVKNSCNP
jgi:HAD superfamily hydrolase (TIGR01484 family)